MKIRNGFVSNSSSSSYVVINKSNLNDIEKFKYLASWYDVVNIPLENGEKEFGWDVVQYTDESKINFAYLQAMYADRPDWANMITKLLKENLGIEHISIDIAWCNSKYGYIKLPDCGYIDHQSNAAENTNTEIFDSEENLKYFLFCDESYIQGDNDNR